MAGSRYNVERASEPSYAVNNINHLFTSVRSGGQSGTSLLCHAVTRRALAYKAQRLVSTGHTVVKLHTALSVHESQHLLIGSGSKPLDVRARRKELGVMPSMKRVDTCAAEFQADTPYMYSSYDGSDECEPTNAKKVRLR